MLSDRERATWEEIQDQVLAEDPGFARIFDAPASPPPDPPPAPVAARRGVHRILVWCAAVLGVLLLVAGSVGGALLVAMVGVALFMERR